MPYSAFQPQTHRPSGQGLGLCSIHCPRASRLGREGYAAWCLTQPRPSSRVEGAAPLSRPRSNAAARWVKKPLMRIRGARGRCCGGPVLGPSCLMYTWLHAGSPVGASPAACEPEGKRQGPYLKACGRTDGPASYHGTGSHGFQAPGICLLFTKATGNAARARGLGTYPGLQSWEMSTWRTARGSHPLHLATSSYLVPLVLFVSIIISGQFMAAEGAGICLEKKPSSVLARAWSL